MNKILKFIKNYKFHIIMFIIILVLFIILKNIELTYECKHLYNYIPCPCTYDVFGFSILKALKGYIVPFILIIYFIVKLTRLIIDIYQYNKLKIKIVYSLLVVIIIYLFNYITNILLNTIFV